MGGEHRRDAGDLRVVVCWAASIAAEATADALERPPPTMLTA
jgi:hypothetical protein